MDLLHILSDGLWTTLAVLGWWVTRRERGHWALATYWTYMAIATVGGAVGQPRLDADPLADPASRVVLVALEGVTLGWAFGFVACAFHYYVGAFVRWVLLGHLVLWIACIVLGVSPQEFEGLVRAVGITTTSIVWVLIVRALVSGRPRPGLPHLLILLMAIADAVAWALPLSSEDFAGNWPVARALMVLAQSTMAAIYLRWLTGRSADPSPGREASV